MIAYVEDSVWSVRPTERTGQKKGKEFPTWNLGSKRTNLRYGMCTGGHRVQRLLSRSGTLNKHTAATAAAAAKASQRQWQRQPEEIPRKPIPFRCDGTRTRQRTTNYSPMSRPSPHSPESARGETLAVGTYLPWWIHTRQTHSGLTPSQL